jgi:hypothetical protein
MKPILNFCKQKYNLILYFFIAIVGFGSIGVWLPMLLDWFMHNSEPQVLTKATKEGTPNNIVTYFLSIFLVSLIDRILNVIDKEDYKHRKTEIIISIIILVAVAYCVLKSYKLVRMNDFDSANSYALIGAGISYLIWWIANYQDKKTDPYVTLGGQNF